MVISDAGRQRFGGTARLYGEKALQLFADAHNCVVGIGGVGSWAAEALARTGIGAITLIDMDDVCVTNTNRQIHALRADAHNCVVGIGGVGSWAAEALARTGIGAITLIDMDDVCVTNTNRQIHALRDNVGLAKAEVMAERVSVVSVPGRRKRWRARGLAQSRLSIWMMCASPIPIGKFMPCAITLGWQKRKLWRSVFARLTRSAV